MRLGTPVVLFDIDGTLCNIEHRVHFVNGKHDYDVPSGGDPTATWKCRKCGRYIDIVAAEKHGGKVSRAKCNEDWRSFYESMRTDQAIEPMTGLLRLMLLTRYCAIGLTTGRPEEYRGVTEGWLQGEAINSADLAFLTMRKDGDFRADDVIKAEMLEEISQLGYEVSMVFDDRQKVVDMWRSKGLLCLQVAPGNF